MKEETTRAKKYTKNKDSRDNCKKGRRMLWSDKSNFQFPLILFKPIDFDQMGVV